MPKQNDLRDYFSSIIPYLNTVYLYWKRRSIREYLIPDIKYSICRPQEAKLLSNLSIKYIVNESLYVWRMIFTCNWFWENWINKNIAALKWVTRIGYGWHVCSWIKKYHKYLIDRALSFLHLYYSSFSIGKQTKVELCVNTCKKCLPKDTCSQLFHPQMSRSKRRQ